MPALQIGVADAKAKLSSIVRQVDEDGARFVVMKNNRPVARIIPFNAVLPHEDAFGALHDFADAKLVEREKDALAHAMEAKHAHPA